MLRVEARARPRIGIWACLACACTVVHECVASERERRDRRFRNPHAASLGIEHKVDRSLPAGNCRLQVRREGFECDTDAHGRYQTLIAQPVELKLVQPVRLREGGSAHSRHSLVHQRRATATRVPNEGDLPLTRGQASEGILGVGLCGLKTHYGYPGSELHQLADSAVDKRLLQPHLASGFWA